MLAAVVTAVIAQSNPQYGTVSTLRVETYTYQLNPLLMAYLVSMLSKLVTGQNLFTVIWSWRERLDESD